MSEIWTCRSFNCICLAEVTYTMMWRYHWLEIWYLIFHSAFWLVVYFLHVLRFAFAHNDCLCNLIHCFPGFGVKIAWGIGDKWVVCQLSDSGSAPSMFQSSDGMNPVSLIQLFFVFELAGCVVLSALMVWALTNYGLEHGMIPYLWDWTVEMFTQSLGWAERVRFEFPAVLIYLFSGIEVTYAMIWRSHWLEIWYALLCIFCSAFWISDWLSLY